MTRREKTLLVVALLFVTAALWNFWPRAPKVPAADAVQANPAGHKQAAGMPALETFKGSLLAHQARAFKGAERNPFGYGQAKPDPDAIAKLQQEAAERKAQDEQAAREAAERAAAQPPPPPVPIRPSFPYPFMGYIGPPRDEFAVFKDTKGYFYVRRGEIIMNQFVVLDIGYESVELGYVGTSESVRIGLAETAKR
jgi:hypothetical protein